MYKYVVKTIRFDEVLELVEEVRSRKPLDPKELLSRFHHLVRSGKAVIIFERSKTLSWAGHSASVFFHEDSEDFAFLNLVHDL